VFRPAVGYRRPVAEKDPYELLGVPRDASDERIRAAYELVINRATRDGAFRYAAELSTAYDTISTARRRALYERHGFAAISERSPGTAPPPGSWRVAQSQPIQHRPRRRRVRKSVLVLLVVAAIVGLFATTRLGKASERPGAPPPIVRRPVVVQPSQQHTVLCESTPGGGGYTYTEPESNRPHCTNGAQPMIVSHN
jgi:hypothetical protein